MSGRPPSRALRGLYLLFGLVAGSVLCGACGTGDVFWFDFIPSLQTVTRGGTADYQIRIVSKVNIESQVDLAVAGLPAGFTLSGLPVRLPSTESDAAFSVHVPADADVGQYEIRIVATEIGHDERTLTAHLIVVAGDEPDFSVRTDKEAFTWTSESSINFLVTVMPLNGFRGTVDFSLGAVPDDLSLDVPLTPTSLEFTDDLAQSTFFRIGWNGPASRQATIDGEVVVTATSGSLSHSRTIELHWPADGSPDFTLDLVPAEVTYDQPSTVETFTYTVRPENGFSGTVTVALSDPPAGFIVTQGPEPAALEVGPPDAASGTFSVYFDGRPGPPAVLTLTATSGSISREASCTLNRPAG